MSEWNSVQKFPQQILVFYTSALRGLLGPYVRQWEQRKSQAGRSFLRDTFGSMHPVEKIKHLFFCLNLEGLSESP